MKEYEVIAVGSGVGASIASRAVSDGRSVALVDRGPAGGTCVNLGCIPSKMLIAPADLAVTSREGDRVGVNVPSAAIDFQWIMERMRENRSRNSNYTRTWIEDHAEELDFYEGEGRFVAEYTLEVNGTSLRGEKIFLCTGARPLIPPIGGLDSVDYLTNESVLELEMRPESLIIIGGGYVACEYGHFFAATGCGVTILQRNERLLPEEEPEISMALEQRLAGRMRVITALEVDEVASGSEGVRVTGTDQRTGERRSFAAARVMVATGRRSNADTLSLEQTGVEIDDRGYMITDAYLQTTKDGIYAVGDANGKQMFRHAANREAGIAWRHATGEAEPMDYRSVPHAVYSHPRIASVGLGEVEARQTHRILIGKAQYGDVTMGEAIGEESGFVKLIVEEGSRRILGCHILGPSAPLLIQEVVNAIALDGTVEDLGAIHIHPSLSEVIPAALRHLRPP
ncbi:MAG: dihydrolipoyl dehydrogenase [Methanomicrobiaceae archaeon]|nr:dihydrolipoyl dehydrogenase [Methanomicrobiaceae archaeon]